MERRPQQIKRINAEHNQNGIGLLTLADLFGLDTCSTILKYLHTTTNSNDFLLPQILETKVKNGQFGYKVKQGFFDYTLPTNNIPVSDLQTFDVIMDEYNDILKDAVQLVHADNSAAVGISEETKKILVDICIAVEEVERGKPIDVVDKEMEILSNIGPLKLADFIGIDVVVKKLWQIYYTSGEEEYKPPATLQAMV